MGDQVIRFIPKKDIYWDNNGRFVMVFEEGYMYNGIKHESGAITAETPYYKGVSDYIEPELIDIV